MCLHTENPIENSHETLFEDILRRISVKAFEALITCGVRDINGFLGMNAEQLTSAGVKPRISAELMDLQRQTNVQITPESDAEVDDGTGIVTGSDEIHSDALAHVSSPVEVGTPIPEDLLRKLTTRALNVMVRESIVSCEHLLSFQQHALYELEGVGTTTVQDIQRLQARIVERYPKFARLVNRHAQRTMSQGQERPFFYPRILDFSRLGERKPSDPAEWSLLVRTLPEVLELHQSVSPGKESGALDDCPSLDSLNIPMNELERFRGIALFPEDSADLLLSVTIGYLLEVNLSEKAFSTIVDYCARYFGHTSQSVLPIPTDSVSDETILLGLPIDEIAEFAVIPLPDDIALVLDENSLSTVHWSDIALLSEQSIIKRFGFTKQGLITIKHVWQLKDQAFDLYQELSAGLSAEMYADFDILVDAFVETVAKNDRELTILKGRLGLLDGRKWTLEELGHHQAVTRSRIQQIDKKRTPLLRLPENVERLNRLWLAVDETLTDGGGRLLC